MSQNLSSYSMSAELAMEIGRLLSQIEDQMTGLTPLEPARRRGIVRMGGKSEQFCRQALNVMLQNPQMLPSSVLLADAVSDLQTVDRLRPLLARLTRLMERMRDTEIALGSDVMDCALQGYKLLGVAGRNQGLQALRRGLSGRFARGSRAADDTPPSPGDAEAA